MPSVAIDVWEETVGKEEKNTFPELSILKIEKDSQKTIEESSHYRIILARQSQVENIPENIPDDFWKQATEMHLVETIYTDDKGESVLIINAKNLEEANEILNQDPLIRLGFYKVHSVKKLESKEA